VDAAGDTGESEPAVAIEDALATFDADRIIVFSHPEGDRDYREDEGLAEAESAEEETVERLEEQGVDAAGDTGESEPAVALQDALATIPADRIVVFSHPEGDRDYREDEGLADVEERFGIPVTHALIGR